MLPAWGGPDSVSVYRSPTGRSKDQSFGSYYLSGEIVHETSDVPQRGVCWASGFHYAVVPSWVVDADVSHAAVRLYAILSLYDESREPTLATLAKRLGCSVGRIERLLAELDSAATAGT